MKKIIFIAVILFATWTLQAQKDTAFYKHEVRASVGDAVVATVFWTTGSTWGDRKNNTTLYANVSFAYFYRPVKWFWVGGNFVNYIGEKISYEWREYYPNGSYRDFSKSKIKYCAVIAPEIRFSYLNHRAVILYSALSGGVCIENGYDSREKQYPEINRYFHITCFGFSCNFGEKKNIFLGGEGGIGYKGIFIFHGGYRF